ncbi:integrating conjugative element protein PilL, PFGI-1 class [Delftia tsuruhatensis]|uniref:PFGI-1 class ICE element type IV pilus protein PilL2 n=1 Tax=Delftia tsuruhatensis TaxID=180282 RepID=UPI001E709E5C|nr:PilL N-terminal domain-containing protein [Delftia tsuruhatensis]CAB5670751.1 integrating conjugative element protein PilL, PFGI-1 class [Delftia tsuruhatensis]CAC9683074.1 integrating conjugative element protein PilL, PFGI-1 class [Delftia tsuruhatensis]
MPAILRPSHPPACRLVLATALLLAGCNTLYEPVRAMPDVASAQATADPASIAVLRQGRYTLVELAPSAAQRDLLRQVVEVALPTDAQASVGDGLRHVLKRSGYRLCAEPSVADSALYSLPLPLAHQRLGPMTLREALLTLAGPAWLMQADERQRVICFAPADQVPQVAASEAGATDTVPPTPAFATPSGALP